MASQLPVIPSPGSNNGSNGNATPTTPAVPPVGQTSPAQNQQTPNASNVPSPGLDPGSTSNLKIVNVNPPLTPDQVVGLYNTPIQQTALPTLKLQDIKVPNIKNRTIQSHLKAIEAKMIMTEKLMKDIVKFQKHQIISEKELNERRRELYQNTFEEYLLDKTIDFRDDDNPDCICLNIPKKPTPGGMPGGANQPTPVNPPTPTGTQTPSTTTTNTPADKPAPKPAPKPTPTPTTPPVQPGTPRTPQQPNYPWWDPRRYFPKPTPTQPTTPHRPGQPTPTQPTTPPHRPTTNPPRTRPPVVPKTPKVPPIIEPLEPLDPDGPGPLRPMPTPEPGVQPVEPYNGIRGYTRARTPVSGGAQYRAGLPAPGGTIGGLAMIGGQMLTGIIDQQNAKREIERIQKLRESNPKAYNDEIWRLRNDISTQIEKATSPITGAYNYTILQGLGEAKPEDKPYIDRITNKASGAAGDLELYSSESQNYFRNISSQITSEIASDIPLGPHTPLPHPGYVKPQGNFIPRPNLRGMPGPMGNPMPWGWQPTLLAKGGLVKPYGAGGIEKISHFLPQSTVMGYIENAPKAKGGITIPDPVTTLTRDVRTAGGGGIIGGLDKIGRSIFQKVGGTLGRNKGRDTSIPGGGTVGEIMGQNEGEKIYEKITEPLREFKNPLRSTASNTLERVQSNLTSNTNNKPTVIPLPPDYIKIPMSSSSKSKSENDSFLQPPGIENWKSIFSLDNGSY